MKSFCGSKDDFTIAKLSGMFFLCVDFWTILLFNASFGEFDRSLRPETDFLAGVWLFSFTFLLETGGFRVLEVGLEGFVMIGGSLRSFSGEKSIFRGSFTSIMISEVEELRRQVQEVSPD
ncbi:hypothetical protein HanIR_Chr08g0371991 [Helianthus annuus]|nr:hypothetical protein HanIR_Chr08g0371991 [Helianthus annuus]